jgi:hypothetical protein
VRHGINVWSERKRIQKLRYMHRNPVKRGLVSALPSKYLMGEQGTVRINDTVI